MEITVENLGTVEIPDELKSAIFSKFESDYTNHLTGKEFIVKPKADYDKEFNTALEVANNKAIREEGAKLYWGVDTAVEMALGEKKPDKMSSRDWYAKLQEEGKLPMTKEAIEKVRASMVGQSSETKNALVEGLEKQLKDFKTESDKKVTEAFDKTVKAALNADLRNAPVVIDPNLKDEAAKATAKNGAISDLKTLFNTLYEGKEDSESGELYFVKKGTDKALMNVAENRPMTPTEIIRANHPMFLAPVGHSGSGTGTGKGQQQRQPGSYGDLADVREAAKEKGLAVYSKDWYKFVEEESKKIVK